jgi:hypothetical protein
MAGFCAARGFCVAQMFAGVVQGGKTVFGMHDENRLFAAAHITPILTMVPFVFDTRKIGRVDIYAAGIVPPGPSGRAGLMKTDNSGTSNQFQ